MNHSKHISPVGWYIATYQLRFVELADKRKHDLERRFCTWENTVLVGAKNLNNAYRKVVKLGKGHTKPYKGGPDAVDVQWLFEGVIELLPVYEEIKDGAEIMWGERTRTLKNIRRLAKKATEFQHHKPRPTNRSSTTRRKRRAV
jgi:hypothetical protein